MKKRFSCFLSLLLTCLLLFTCAAAENYVPTQDMPAKGLRITSQPQDVSVREGGSCTITLSAEKQRGITWRLYDPETGDMVLVSKAASRFPGLKVSGKNSQKLGLEHISADLNGWMVFCELTRGKERIISRYALITVTDAAGDALPGAREFLLDPTEIPQITVRAEGAHLQHIDYKSRLQKGSFDELTFDFSADCAVVAEKKTRFWSINGVQYDFGAAVKTIILRQLTWDMDISAIPDGNPPAADDEAENLTVRSIRAKMRCLADGSKPAGQWFDEMNFDAGYTSPATGFPVDEGLIDLLVQASVPAGQYLSYWKFNEAHVDFDNRVYSFTVHGLNTTFTYEPVFGTPKKETVSEPQKDDDRRPTYDLDVPPGTIIAPPNRPIF